MPAGSGELERGPEGAHHGGAVGVCAQDRERAPRAPAAQAQAGGAYALKYTFLGSVDGIVTAPLGEVLGQYGLSGASIMVARIDPWLGLLWSLCCYLGKCASLVWPVSS